MRATLKDSLEFEFPDTRIRTPITCMELDVAGGGTLAAHFLLNDLKPGATVRLGVKGTAGEKPAAAWFRLVDVPVERNTGIGKGSFVEQHPGENKFVIRRAPFRVYDAMAPVPAAVKATAATMAFRLHLPVPANARVGVRAYTLTVQHGKGEANFGLQAQVFRSVIPPVGAKSFPYRNGFDLGNMATRHNLKLWSAAHWRMIRRYADLMVHGRQNTFSVGDTPTFQRTRQGLILNRAQLRREVKLFSDAGMYFILGDGLPSATSAAGHVDLAFAARQLMEEIKRNHWQGRWIQRVSDEPGEENATDYRLAAGMIRKYLPGVPLFEPVMTPNLPGALDIWCPTNKLYQLNRQKFESYRDQGDRIWFYTCCTPGSFWINRLLDMELIRCTLVGWGAARFGLDGFLHWGLNRYHPDQDPFQQGVEAGDNPMPAGDRHLVYPGADGPWSSLRLEAHREGFEDLELLNILQRRDPRLAAAIIRKVFRRFDRYTKRATQLRAARRALLQAL